MKEESIKILLVEDNPGDVRLVKEMLAEADTVHFELVHCERLASAVEFLKRESFKIILLDLSLPDRQGLDTVIQTHLVKPDIPIVVMSNMGDEDLAVQALHEGAQDYLVKGRVDTDLLIRAIRYSMERKETEEALRRAYDEMELRVRERTGELILTNEALLQEIAERRKTELALQRSEASLAEAQRIAGLGNWVWDIQNNELSWSDEIYRIFGSTPQEFGATYDEFLRFVHPDDRKFVEKSVNEALYGAPYNIEHRIVLPDGTVRYVYEQGEVTFGESGEPVRLLGTVQDITENKEKEMRLVMSERLASLGQLASGIAHEINNPLASIAACAEGLLSRIKSGRQNSELFANYLQIISEEVMRCKGITTSMLSFVRETAYEKKDIDIHAVLDKTLELIGFQGRLREVKVVKNYEGMLSVRASEGELKQVFLALFVNALDSMGDRGTLAIDTGRVRRDSSSATGEESDTVFIRISDTGTGIPAEIMGKIFEPFYTTKSRDGGTGLGLSIALKMIKDHGGSVKVKSENGKGTVFTIVLPG